MGALRLYGRGWARICDYSGTATIGEFWWFTAINTVVYAVAQSGALLLITAWGRSQYQGSDIGPPLLNWIAAIVAITVILVLPWKSLLARRIRDATASNKTVFVVVLVPCISLALVFVGLYWFLLLAALGFLVALVLSLLPSRALETEYRGAVMARARFDHDQREADDPWAR